ncbi:SGNH/GDSL hydrolase family protein [bacterium]|nr:SGNH/GDSL hydrolase family protein [bacterium]
MKKRAILIRLLIVISSFLPFLLLEFSLRLFNPAIIQKKVLTLNKLEESFKIFKPDLNMGWRLLPNTRRYLVIPTSQPVRSQLNPKYKYTASINSLGYRTWEFKPKKSEDVFRIICLGDSTTFGWGIYFPDVYAHKLGNLLGQSHKDKKVEVLSCGIPGYTSRQGLVLIKEEILPLYSPDLLVVAYGPCDSQLVDIPDNVTIKERNLLNIMDNFFQRFAIYNLIRKIELDITGKIKTPKEITPFPRVSLDDMVGNLGKIKKCAERYNKPIIFLNIVRDNIARHDKMNEFFKKEKCDYIDITTLLKDNLEDIKTNPAYKSQIDFYIEYYGKDVFYSNENIYLYLDFVHPNSIGHLLIAQALQKRIEEEFLSNRD